jgi:hypothetical protein
MKGQDDAKIEIGMVEMGPGWVLFVPAMAPKTDHVRVPKLLNQSLIYWLRSGAAATVRQTLPIVEDGNTIALHVWFDPAPVPDNPLPIDTKGEPPA